MLCPRSSVRRAACATLPPCSSIPEVSTTPPTAQYQRTSYQYNRIARDVSTTTHPMALGSMSVPPLTP
eukprot:2283112-Rhodomonas_salina.1